MKFQYTLLFVFLAFFFSAEAKQIPPKSATLVTDYAGILSAAERMNLERLLVAYSDTSSTQIAIVIENTIEGDEIFEYSYRLAENWGIGQDGKDNGVLLFIAFEDRDMWIQTGYGAEGFLPDAMIRRILDNVLIPAFRAGNYYQGLNESSTIIMQLAAGEYTEEGGKKKSGFRTVIIIFLLLAGLLFLFSFFAGGDDTDDDSGYNGRGKYDDYDDFGGGQNRRKRRSRGGGWIFLPGGGFGGGGFGGGGGGFGDFGGGGFGGFGGGGFGGGGAGGSW